VSSPSSDPSQPHDPFVKQPPPGAPGDGRPGHGQQAPPQQGYGQQGYGQQQVGGYPPPGYPTSPELAPDQQRLWATLGHLSPLVTTLVGLNALGPLIVFLVYKDRGVFIRRQAAEALNFQILFTIIYLASLVLSVLTLGIGAIVYFPLGVVWLVFMIIAAVNANKGIDYRYPFNWRLVH
jgi:uncharacterized Tic20 family protein